MKNKTLNAITKTLLTGLLTVVVSMNSFGQIDVSSDVSDSKTGLYVNEGKTKIESFDCYDFSDLVLAVDVNEEFFNYENLGIELTLKTKGSEYGIKYRMSVNRVNFMKFKDKPYAHFKLIEVKNNEEQEIMLNMTQSNNSYKVYLKRSDLNYTSSKSKLNNMVIEVKIYGGKRNGGSISYFAIDSFSVPLNNRIKISSFGKVPEVVKSNCYELPKE